MEKNCVESVKLVNSAMGDFRSLVDDMIDVGYDYQHALKDCWPWVKPAKTNIEIVLSEMIKKERAQGNETPYARSNLETTNE